MPKIERKTQKIFGGNAESDQLAVFGSMITGTPVYNDDVETLQSEAYTEGWQVAVAANEAPFMEEMNGVQYGFSKQLAYLFQQGIAEWDAGTTYYLNSFCQVGGVIYKSMQDENINHSPADDTEGTYWSPLETGGGGSSGLEVCDIGMALYVDETKGLRRRLNGTTVSVNTNTQAFINKLKSIAALYPSLACTETEWSQIESASDLGQVGKFVIQDEEEIQYYAYSSGSTTYLTTSTEDSDSVNVYSTEFVLQGTGSISSGVLTYESQTYNRASGSDTTQEVEAYVRLPKVINVQGLIDLQNLGVTVKAGLPNITGTSNGYCTAQISNGSGVSGCIYNIPLSVIQGATNNAGWSAKFGIDASLSNSIYGNSTTVQPEAIQYPYYIQIATGQETEVNITNDIESIVPYTLFDSKYSEAKQYNASWVLGGSTLSKRVYPTAYEAALVEYNSEIADGTTVELPSGGSYTKRGVSGGITVKLSTDETATEYDWKLDTAAETFIAPTASRLASGKAVVGNGKGLGLTEGTNNMVLINYADTGANSYGANFSTAGYGLDVGASSAPSGVALNKAIGIVADPTKSGIELSGSNLYLYFLVASVAQNAPLANLGRIEETKVDKNSSWGFPSNRYIDLTLGASGTEYTAPANGIFYAASSVGSVRLYTNSFSISSNILTGNWGGQAFMPVKTGDKVGVAYTNSSTIVRFIYAEGSKE